MLRSAATRLARYLYIALVPASDHIYYPSAMAQPQPVAGDEPVWVKDDDEDLEELVVDLNLDKEAESTARQIDLQVAPGLWW